MKLKAQQIWPASVLALVLAVGSTGCSGPASAVGGQAPAQALQDTVASIQEYARSDPNPPKGQATSPAEDKIKSHFDPSMDATKRSDVVMIFADILSADPNATVEVRPDGIAVSGDTAVVKSSDLKITIRGQEQEAQGDGGSLTMKAHDGKWLIADVSFPPAPSDNNR